MGGLDKGWHGGGAGATFTFSNSLERMSQKEEESSIGPDQQWKGMDQFGHRLFLLSLALSVIAFCACLLLIPVLMAELDELSELAKGEGKAFKALADGIWVDLMRLQGRPAWGSHSSRVIPLRNRPERELQMSPTEIKHFQDRLERKSFKGRQRLKQSFSSSSVPPFHLEAEKVPRARPWSFAAQTYEEKNPIQEGKTESLINGESNFKCPSGPPGTPGLPGLDGVPGENGIPGKSGKSGTEVQNDFDKSDCIKCPAGLPGLVGSPGLNGLTGENGVPGVPGIAKNPLPGPPGPIGEAGLDGVNGSEGVAGLPGLPGISYKKGASGPKGEIGLSGEPGMPGEHGQNGEPGMQGEQGLPGQPGMAGFEGVAGPIGPVGLSGIPGIENHYCNCPIRTSQLMRLKDQPGGVKAYLGRWKGRLPSQLLDDYEKFIKEKDAEFKIKLPPFEVQN